MEAGGLVGGNPVVINCALLYSHLARTRVLGYGPAYHIVRMEGGGGVLVCCFALPLHHFLLALNSFGPFLALS